MFPSSSLSRIDLSYRKATIISLAGNLPLPPIFHAPNQRHLQPGIPIHGRGMFTERAILKTLGSNCSDGYHPEAVTYITAKKRVDIHAGRNTV